MPDRKYTKVEEEIIQILDRMDDDAATTRSPHLRLVHSAPATPKRWRIPRSLPTRLTPGITLALVFMFAFVALMTSGWLQLVATALSLGCFVLLIVRRRRVGGGDSGTVPGSKMWRGRDISLTPEYGEPLSDRIREWIQRVRR